MTMGISFQDSLKQIEEQKQKVAVPMSLNEEINTIPSIYANEAETWTPISDKGYLFYNDYSDENYSVVNSEKEVTLDPKQINLTQETNSQFIPFRMPRYYDGFDLTTTKLEVYFVNRQGQYGINYPVNVYYSEDKIKFGWLVDSSVTMLDGTVKFEIHAVGKTSLGDTYIWKTRPNTEMNVLQSLTGSTFIEPDETWKEDFLLRINDKVETAQQAVRDAQTAANAALADANRAELYYKESVEISKNLSDGIADEVQYAVETQVSSVVDTKIEDALSNYYTKKEVRELIDNVDISEQLEEVRNEIANLDGLAKFNVEYDGKVMTFYNGEEIIKTIPINSDPTDEWTEAYTTTIDEKITLAKTELQNNLDTHISNSNDTFATKLNLVEINQKVAVIESSANTNKENIDIISDKIVELQKGVDSVDKSPRLTYDASYNEDGDNKFKLIEIEHEGDSEKEVRTEKASFVIQGGSGGSSSSSVLKIEYITKTPMIVTVDGKVLISYLFSGTDSSGDEVLEGTATWKVGNTIVATHLVAAGENTFDITEYIAIGSQKVVLSIVDDAGSTVTKRWTIQKLDVRLESNFNDKLSYSVGNLSFSYTPYGAISKDVHFILNNKEIGKVNTSVSGIPLDYELTGLTHGSHLLDAYMTADINGSTIETNHITKDIICLDPDSNVPVIGCVQQKITAKQYDTTNITYTVYDPTTETPTVTLAVDDVVQRTLTLTKSTDIWQYKSTDVGEHILTITCGETVKTLVVTIEKLDINVNPITSGLAFDFNPTGRSNNDADRIWTDNNVSMSTSENFDWINGGYQLDENGDSYFCVKAGTSVVIDYQLFADDAKVNGKEFKVVFKTTNVKKRDTSFISCLNNGIGLDMRVENTQIYSSNSSLYSPYCEEDIIEFEFNINKSSDIPLVLTYEDGVGNRPMIYTSDASFWQTTPQPITIGSNDCDVHIYRMKAYTRSLSDSDILSNFIADARNADEMISRYNRNQIYDENNLLSPEVLAEKCPNLRIIMIDAPWFTNDKDNKVDDTIIRMIYKNGDALLDNWTCTGARHSGQGTSSNEYGYASRNVDLIMDRDTSLFTLGDGITTSKTITLTRDSVPTDYLNVKVNVASSENENNAQMARRYNQYNPFVRAAKFNDSRVKDCMEFYNCVVFIRERDTDISTHREFQDTNWHFYSIGNVGDSKKTDDTRVNDKNDPKEFVLEITDYNVALAEFPTGNEDGSICSVDNWKEGNTAYDYLYAAYKYKEGEFKSFGSESYEFRYEMSGLTEEQREVNINAWRDMYKFVVTSTDEEFYNRLKEYFVVDSALYYYLFTERYTMVDNRAKNSFWHYGKVYITEETAIALGDAAGGYIVDNEQAAINDGYRFDLSFGYDFDTSLGIDNTGKLVLTYGKEDTDYYVEDDPSSAYIYRAAKSTFFCRLRDLFKSELQGMFVNREDANAWSATGLINQWDNAQNEFPEELWRLNIQRIYIRTYKGVSIDNSIAGEANPRFLTEMMNGRKKYQRRMFERNQELYMATKYFGKTATQDQIMMRFNNPETYVLKPNFTLYLTPYSDMYIGVKFGNVEAINFRAKAGKEYTIPYSLDTADITLIYGASFIQGIGDLSKCYVGDNDFSKASRLQRLVIGSDIEGYSNTYMKKISLGNNKLLEYLDIRNTSALEDVVDLSNCGNLLELYAQGSGATGVIFANGGKIEKFYIPAVVSLTMNNLNHIKDFSIESYENIKTLIVEYTPIIDTYDIVNSSKLQTLRLVGMNWNIEDTSTLDKALLLRGVNSDGGEIAQSVLIGKVHVPVIRQQQLYNYLEAWSDLEITFNTMIEQYPVTFVNEDGIVLEIQYVDKGGTAIDPTTREENPIVPQKESTVSHNFVFNGWDSVLTDIFAERTVTATYVSELRSYTIKYVAKGITMQESTGLYGENVPYKGVTPTYTAEETGFVYYLFNRWDKSGFIDGNKTVNAIFDKFEYTTNSFHGKELADFSPVEIYALTKRGVDNVEMGQLQDDGTYEGLQDGDDYTIVVGNDIDYDDIESELLISEKMHFNGTNHFDTGIQLFDEDKDFVLAIDYEFLTGNKNNSVLAQCFQSNGTNGFKLWYGTGSDFSGAKLTWGTVSDNIIEIEKREIVVIRHKKGDNNLTVYKSNLDNDVVLVTELSKNKITLGTGTLVFGCAKADDGIYENHAIGNVNWAKVWFADLGDDVCKDLAMWTHESVTLEVCGFRKYYLTENISKRCSFSLLATHLLGRTKKWNPSNTNDGGWAMSTLNTSLNTRLYNAIPTQIRSLIKQVIVKSSDGIPSNGNQYTEVTDSNCYITIPAIVELSSDMTTEPYNSEGTPISYFSTDDSRKRAFDGGDYYEYWTRSPNAEYSNYIYRIDEKGSVQPITNATTECGILVEVSF